MEKSFNTKKMIVNAILIAIGAVLHTISPTFGVAQPDFALAMMFIIILINKDYKTALFSGIIVGIFTALTTKTVGGQAPNIIDKVITANVAYLILLPFEQSHYFFLLIRFSPDFHQVPCNNVLPVHKEFPPCKNGKLCFHT